MTESASYRWNRPRLFPLIFVIGAVLTLLGLGSWQVKRLEWKETILAQIEQEAKTPPLPLDTTKPPVPFRRVALHGHF